MLQFDIVTIFPEQIGGFLKEGIFRIASESGAAKINVHDLRKWTNNVHKSVDDRPFGGGPGMVLKIEPIDAALKEIKQGSAIVMATSPAGYRWEQKVAKSFAQSEVSEGLFDSDTQRRTFDQIVIVAGHYEGYDQRILDHLVDFPISMGDYVLSGGELPALTIIDSVVRLLPGVLGNEQSAQLESFETELLDFPQYTRPREYNGWGVPEELLSGNHAEIEKWRAKVAAELTKKFR